MAEKRTVILVAGLPGQDFSAIRDVCAREGLAYVEIDRQEPPADATGFVAALSRLNRRIFDLVGYGWADTRMLPQDASRQNIDQRFDHWVSGWMQSQFAKVWDEAPADGNQPLVIAGDSLMPTHATLARMIRRQEETVQTLLLGLRSHEALAQFKAQIPDEVGMPGAPQLWLKHALLGLFLVPDQKEGHLAHWLSHEDQEEGFAAFLKTGSVPRTGDANAVAQKPYAHPVQFDMLAATDKLLDDWPALKPGERGKRTTALLNSLRATASLYGDVSEVPENLMRYRIPLAAARKAGGRPVILHYHFFKNAGTSVDAMLRENFGQLWDSREFQNEPDIAASVSDWVLERPRMRAFSSHTMTGPLPVIEGVRLLPIMFIRHPIDRVKSAYLFERRQTVDNNSTELAKSADFARYVEAKLDGGFGSAVVNFNSERLATFAPGGGTRLDRALKALDILPFVGLVEHFEASIRRMERLVRELYPRATFDMVLKNATRDPLQGLEVRLQEIRQELGDALYARLEAANADDIVLFERLDSFYRQQEK